MHFVLSREIKSYILDKKSVPPVRLCSAGKRPLLYSHTE